MKLKLAWKQGPAHYQCRVFVGSDRDNLALAGTLMLRPIEAVAFRNTVRQGIFFPGADGIFESGWEGDEYAGGSAASESVLP